MHTYTHTHIHTHIHTYIHTYIRTYIHTHIHTYIHAYIHTYTHTHIHTHTHTYIHTCIHTYIIGNFEVDPVDHHPGQAGHQQGEDHGQPGIPAQRGDDVVEGGDPGGLPVLKTS